MLRGCDPVYQNASNAPLDGRAGRLVVPGRLVVRVLLHVRGVGGVGRRVGGVGRRRHGVAPQPSGRRLMGRRGGVVGPRVRRVVRVRGVAPRPAGRRVRGVGVVRVGGGMRGVVPVGRPRRVRVGGVRGRVRGRVVVRRVGTVGRVEARGQGRPRVGGVAVAVVAAPPAAAAAALQWWRLVRVRGVAVEAHAGVVPVGRPRRVRVGVRGPHVRGRVMGVLPVRRPRLVRGLPPHRPLLRRGGRRAVAARVAPVAVRVRVRADARVVPADAYAAHAGAVVRRGAVRRVVRGGVVVMAPVAAALGEIVAARVGAGGRRRRERGRGDAHVDARGAVRLRGGVVVLLLLGRRTGLARHAPTTAVTAAAAAAARGS